MWAKNYGKSPAFYVGVRAVPMLDKKDWKTLSKRSCQLAEADVKSGTGSYTFPDRELILGARVDSETPHGNIGTAYIAGCIAYLDEGLKVIHHTRFCVQRDDPTKMTFANNYLDPCDVDQTAD